jgi:NAD(P)-dependent dehydrogenase (short-subunit alcohol dehydrogenase family)
MRELRGKTAVITGGASGIGRAMADAFAAEGMRLVLADVEAGALEQAVAELRAGGASALGVPTDVSRAEQVEALAERAVGEFGRVDVLCNNAGVALSGRMWENSLRDWEWLLGVNLWGVIHGIRTFVPLMLKQGGEGHIVNTGSVAGLLSNPFMGIYNASKHAVVTLSETLHKELGLLETPIKVSVLCPGFVSTRILDSERNRPQALRNATPSERHPTFEEMAQSAIAAGLPPATAAARVLDAIKQERFYVLTHPEFAPRVRARLEDIVEGRNPVVAQSIG